MAPIAPPGSKAPRSDFGRNPTTRCHSIGCTTLARMERSMHLVLPSRQRLEQAGKGDELFPEAEERKAIDHDGITRSIGRWCRRKNRALRNSRAARCTTSSASPRGRIVPRGGRNDPACWRKPLRVASRWTWQPRLLQHVTRRLTTRTVLQGRSAARFSKVPPTKTLHSKTQRLTPITWNGPRRSRT